MNVQRLTSILLAIAAASCAANVPIPSAAATHVAKSAPAALTKSSAKSAAQASAKVSMADLAPADAYFGPLKLSILGMRNMIKDAGLRYDVDNSKANSTFGVASQVELSVKEWERKYPRDTQLPRTVYYLQRLYAKIDLDASRSKASGTQSWMFGRYGKTPQAKALRKELAKATPAPARPTDGPGAGPPLTSELPTTPPAASSVVPVLPTPIVGPTVKSH